MSEVGDAWNGVKDIINGVGDAWDWITGKNKKEGDLPKGLKGHLDALSELQLVAMTYPDSKDNSIVQKNYPGLTNVAGYNKYINDLISGSKYDVIPYLLKYNIYRLDGAGRQVYTGYGPNYQVTGGATSDVTPKNTTTDAKTTTTTTTAKKGFSLDWSEGGLSINIGSKAGVSSTPILVPYWLIYSGIGIFIFLLLGGMSGIRKLLRLK